MPSWIRLWIAAVSLLVLSGCVSMSARNPMEKAEALVEAGRPLVIAHRGFSAIAPENTLESFRLALSAGADMVELDYYHTRDGIPVVIHDATLDRTTDAAKVWNEQKIRVDKKSMEELSKLDAGRWYNARYAGSRLPSLTEALEFIQAKGVTLIERKAGDAATCAKLLKDENLLNRVVVQAFDWEYLKALHALEPRQILGALGPPSSRNGRPVPEAEKVLDTGWVAQAQQAGARIVVWNRRIQPDAVKEAHRRGMKVWAYTINDPAIANDLLNLGLDGLITDNPALIWRTLALRGR